MVNKFNYLQGGAERYFFELSDILKSKGHEVIPFCMQDKRNKPSEFSGYFVENIDYNRSLKSKGFSSLKLAFKFMYSFEAKNKISALIKKHKPDIAHLHNIYHQLSPSILHALKKHRIPVVMTVHDLKLVCPSYHLYCKGKVCERCKPNKFYHALLTRCVKESLIASILSCMEMYFHKMLKIYEKNVDIFIAPSKFYREKLIEFGFPGQKIVVLPYSIKLDEYRPEYSTSSDYYLYFGRLVEEKGLKTLIEAASRIKDYRLYIAGNGAKLDYFKSLALKIGAYNAEFLGKLDGDKLKEVVSGALFSVVPSQWYENNPLSIYESFALGRPVIASDIGGIPEFVDNKINGLLFDPNNSADLAKKINYLLSRPELRQSMGRAGRQKVETKASPRVHLEMLEGIYKRLLS